MPCTEVEIFDAQGGAFGHAQTGAVQKPRHEERRISQVLQDAPNLVAREHDGQAENSRGALQIVEPGGVDA
jgi:hypothetical protein